VVCSRLHELQEALSAATIALEISSRNAPVAALEKRWDRLRAGLERILDQRGRRHGRSARGRQRDTAPGLQGPESRSAGDPIDLAVVSLFAELRGHERQAAEELGQWKTGVEERKAPDVSPAAIS
jgi:hypothetical protein